MAMSATRSSRTKRDNRKPVRPGSQGLPFPVLLARDDSYQVASKVHDTTVKIQPTETEKIAVVRNMISQHVDVNRIIKALDD